MRHILITTVLILYLAVSNSFAQMGHGMMRGGHMMGEEHMRGMMEEGQMMDHEEMMSTMTEMTGQITEMMQGVTRMMNQSSPADKERMHKLANMIRDLASEMNRISFMMERGDATEEEMKDLQMRIREIKRSMQGL
jgi:methyl-accepting chemotaxis protein